MSVVWAPYSQLPPFCLQRLVVHRDLNAFNFGFGLHEYDRPGNQASAGFSHMGCRVGSVVYCRPVGVVHRNVPSGSWSTFQRGSCLSR
jgi:hypothetical protein